MLSLGIWLVVRTRSPTRRDNRRAEPAPRTTTTLAFVVGVVGGVYGIGGGSILSPVLVGRGVPVAKVVPTALSSTFVTSLVGASVYALLSLAHAGGIAPAGTSVSPAAWAASSAPASSRASPRPSSAFSSATWLRPSSFSTHSTYCAEPLGQPSPTETTGYQNTDGVR